MSSYGLVIKKQAMTKYSYWEMILNPRLAEVHILRIDLFMPVFVNRPS
jgi:hypothetical protein